MVNNIIDSLLFRPLYALYARPLTHLDHSEYQKIPALGPARGPARRPALGCCSYQTDVYVVADLEPTHNYIRLYGDNVPIKTRKPTQSKQRKLAVALLHRHILYIYI